MNHPSNQSNTHPWTTRRGISMAETIVSTMIVGFVLVSTLQVVGPVVRTTSVHADKLIAANLANELSEEIATRRFTDPDVDDPNALGVNDGEQPKTRTAFDDIDDYNAWSATPPISLANGKIEGLAGWTRSVKVAHVELADATTESKFNTGLKRVTVSVSKNGTVLAQITTLQSQSADSIGFMVGTGK
tara:strand:+ start:70517 stop:71080 length:564 start_codon:yes stop_codon:yes gene_type:complete